MPRPRYVVLDLDGTLTDGISGWEWVHRHFGVDNRGNYDAFLRNEMDDDAFTQADIALWLRAGPVRLRDLEHLFETIPLMPGAETLVDRLRSEGMKVGICSGGIETHAHAVARRLGIDHVLANPLQTDPGGFLTGRAVLKVLLKDKAAATERLIRGMGEHPLQGAAVGNSRFDVGMFRVAGLGVAVAPLDAEVAAAAHHVEHARDLTGLVSVLLHPDAPSARPAAADQRPI